MNPRCPECDTEAIRIVENRFPENSLYRCENGHEALFLTEPPMNTPAPSAASAGTDREEERRG